MKDRTYWSIIIVVVALTLLAVPSVQSNSMIRTPATISPLPERVTYPNPIGGLNVTLLGVIMTTPLACSASCAMPGSTIYYLVANGRNYRLVLSNETSLPENVNGWRAVVSGLFVTPSSFQGDQWTPSLYFFGDIYVQKIAYYRTLPS